MPPCPRPPHRRTLWLLALAAAAAARPEAVRAWGEDGHRIVAEIAAARLTPDAQAMVRAVVGDLPLSAPQIATWADAQRDRATRPWHWTDIPFTAPGYQAARDCPRGACAVAVVAQAEATLARRDAGALARADALRWLVHLVADLHQPLHAGDPRDRGGNDCRVRLRDRRQPTNLHRVWDVEVVKPLVKHASPAAAARGLLARLRPAEAAAWAAEQDPAAWAEASNRTARALYAEQGATPGDGVVRTLTPWDYERAQRARVEEALLAAGVRLAEALNRIAAARVKTGAAP